MPISLKHSQKDGSPQYSKPGEMEQQQINNQREGKKVLISIRILSFPGFAWLTLCICYLPTATGSVVPPPLLILSWWEFNKSCLTVLKLAYHFLHRFSKLAGWFIWFGLHVNSPPGKGVSFLGIQTCRFALLSLW